MPITPENFRLSESDLQIQESNYLNFRDTAPKLAFPLSLARDTEINVIENHYFLLKNSDYLRAWKLAELALSKGDPELLEDAADCFRDVITGDGYSSPKTKLNSYIFLITKPAFTDQVHGREITPESVQKVYRNLGNFCLKHTPKNDYGFKSEMISYLLFAYMAQSNSSFLSFPSSMREELNKPRGINLNHDSYLTCGGKIPMQVKFWDRSRGQKDLIKHHYHEFIFKFSVGAIVNRAFKKSSQDLRSLSKPEAKIARRLHTDQFLDTMITHALGQEISPTQAQQVQDMVSETHFALHRYIRGIQPSISK